MITTQLIIIIMTIEHITKRAITFSIGSSWKLCPDENKEFLITLYMASKALVSYPSSSIVAYQVFVFWSFQCKSCYLLSMFLLECKDTFQ